MKKFLLATVSIVALSSVVRAADLPAAMPTKERMYVPAPVATWDGAYIGVQGGVVRRETSFFEFSPFGNFSFDDRKTGGIAGALLGYNWQHGGFVYGLEGDWSWTGTKADHNPSDFIGSFDTKWLATIRGRAGLALDSTLLYLTGGAAFGRVDNAAPFTVSFGGTFLSGFFQNQTKTGWTVGAGVEHMFGPHWTARAEFRYVDLGKTSVNCTELAPASCQTGYRGEFSNKLMLGLVGLAYKF